MSNIFTKKTGFFSSKMEKAPWPGFEPGSRHRAFFSAMSSGRQPLILDRTILPGLSHGQDAEINKEKRLLLKFFIQMLYEGLAFDFTK